MSYVKILYDMFSLIEQKYLLGLLKNEYFGKKNAANSKPSQFYRIMRLLKENDLITITNIKSSNRKEYKLTVFGKAMASLIAKHTTTEGYKKYAFGVEMILV